MEPQELFANLLSASGVLTLLPLVACLVGLLWAPIGASIAAFYARHRVIPVGDAASTAALASVHMLVPWVYVMSKISNQRHRPVIERAFHIGTLALWLLGPISFLAIMGCFVTVASFIERFTKPPGWPRGDIDIFALTIVGSVAAIVMAGLGAFLWYRSLRQVRSEARNEGQGDLWLPVHIVHSLRMTILWSAGSLVLTAIMIPIGLSEIGRG